MWRDSEYLYTRGVYSSEVPTYVLELTVKSTILNTALTFFPIFNLSTKTKTASMTSTCQPPPHTYYVFMHPSQYVDQPNSCRNGNTMVANHKKQYSRVY